ncbi:hypothetical protein H8S07_13290 [Dorea sp. NSJ-36]|uniref:DUF8208 domain-containing protein n=1 Tax=Dorea hominis TaxID=2763040 RepID=A0ABR7F030_9FIRM|nr:hypothetical protein [Dorea hominis]MBC5666205.1 hypothetical protein [Dorea hominis]
MHRKKYYIGAALIAALVILFPATAFAVDEKGILKVLMRNNDILAINNIVSSAVRWCGWSLVKGLAWVATNAANLFDNCFKLVDFTKWGPVENFIKAWKPVFVSLVSLSLLFLGIVLIFWHEKKPKFVMNLCLAVLIVSSSGYLIQQLNGFLADDMRSAIVNDNAAEKSKGIVYDMVGSSVFDLIYLDDHIKGGLMNMTKKNRVTYSDFSENDMAMIDINEIVKPDDVKESSKDLMSHRILYRQDNIQVKESYNGIAWTDLLNEYYYRYNIQWFNCILGLCSLILIYVCLAYKVVRIIYEIVIQRVLAVLYSANLSNSQKTLKIMDSIKDSYITLVLVMICLKIYLLAYKFINQTGFSGFTQAMILLFIAFAVIDGPNIIQKLTGIDAGLSSGTGKIMAGIQASRIAGMMMSKGLSGMTNSSTLDKESRTNNTDQSAKANIAENMNQKNAEMPGEASTNANETNENQKEENSQNDAGNAMNLQNNNTDPEMENAVDSAELGTESANSIESLNGADSGEMTGAELPESESIDAEIPISNDMMDSLNGVDPLNKNANLEDMNKEISHPDELTKRDINHNGTVEFDGQIFHQTWKGVLEADSSNGKTMDSTSKTQGQMEQKKTAPKDIFNP